MTNEEQREVHKRYGELMFAEDQNNAIYDCFVQGVSHDGHVWVTWTDVERLLCDLFEPEEPRTIPAHLVPLVMCPRCGSTFVINQYGCIMRYCPNCGKAIKVTE